MPDRQFDGQGERLTASEAAQELELDWMASSDFSQFVAFRARHARTAGIGIGERIANDLVEYFHLTSGNGSFHFL